MDKFLAFLLTIISFAVLTWGLATDSIARVIGAIGLLFLIASTGKE